MSQVYYTSPTPSSSLSSLPLTNGQSHVPLLSARASARMPSGGSLHQQATRLFLSRDFIGAAACLDLARRPNDPSTARPKDEWFRLVQAGDDSSELAQRLALERKLAVLELTLLATAHPSTAMGGPAPAPSRYPEHFHRLLDLAPRPLLETLWASFLQGDGAGEEVAGGEILPSAAAEFVHPSLATALSLAALKLGESTLARSIAEAWFGSVSQEVDDFIAEAAARVDVMAEFPVAGQGSLGSSQVLPSRPGERPDPAKQLVGSWVKLLDVLSLHVLPAMGEWDEARDAVRLQAGENGGWVPQERIEVSARPVLRDAILGG